MTEFVVLFFVVLFVVVLGYLVSRLVSLVFGALAAGTITGLVPLVLDRMLGIHLVPFTLYNTLLFFVLGVVAFLAYEAAKMFFGVSSLVGRIVLWPARFVVGVLRTLKRILRGKKRKEKKSRNSA